MTNSRLEHIANVYAYACMSNICITHLKRNHTGSDCDPLTPLNSNPRVVPLK